MSAEPHLVELGVQAFDMTVLLQALGLLFLAIVLLVLEVFVVSFGLLSIASIASAAGAIYLAFLVHDAVGWIFVIATPALGVVIARWGIRRIRSSRVVPREEITAEAGYHHAVDRIGVAEGSAGVMVTAARPTGRARFDGGECDVQTRGRPLEVGARIVVDRIDGPMVFVVEVSPESG